MHSSLNVEGATVLKHACPRREFLTKTRNHILIIPFRGHPKPRGSPLPHLRLLGQAKE